MLSQKAQCSLAIIIVRQIPQAGIYHWQLIFRVEVWAFLKRVQVGREPTEKVVPRVFAERLLAFNRRFVRKVKTIQLIKQMVGCNN